MGLMCLGGRIPGCRTSAAPPVAHALLALAVVVASWTVAGIARAASPEQAQIDAIAKADGPSGVASQIVATSKGDVAVVAHALRVSDGYRFEVGSHTVVDAYSYTGGGGAARAG